MTKVDAKRKREPKERDPEQFQRFIEAARKRGMNESLEDFAVNRQECAAKAKYIVRAMSEAEVGMN
jgi:hypothetical protein